MFKKTLTAILALTLILSAVSCGGTTPSGSDTTTGSQTVNNNIPIADIGKAVTDAYGNTVTLDADIDADLLDATYGIKPEWVADFYAKGSFIGFTTDVFIAVKPADGYADKVEAALKSYRDYMIDNASSYPQSRQKVENITVYRRGDYVFYITLGPIDASLDEKAAKDYHIAQNQIAIDAIVSLIG